MARMQGWHIITGAAGGIGAAVAEEIGRRGGSTILIDRPGTALQSTAEAVRAAGSDAVSVELDLMDRAVVAERITGLCREHDVAGLANIAGISHFGDVLDVTDEIWDRMIAIKLTALLVTSRAVIPHFRRRGGGVIINTSSMAGRTQSAVSSAAYVAANAGVIGLTMSLAAQEGPNGVRVNTVAPGFIDTSMYAAYRADGRSVDVSGVPLRRVGAPSEIATTFAFLMSEDASYISGQTINVNGGAFQL